ncbi:LuxR family transcriptional regulator [Stenotrophomonas maltophilia group sp. RY12688]|uniref:LuxR family transcriptional regulator n=1 Tax=Stenotrophomonas maltophilia group sp. RY12688 TaxID=3454438 RepID=UPI003F9ADCEB
MKLLSAVLLCACSLPAGLALAVEASPSPLLGRWSLDTATSALPEAQRPKRVVLEFKDAGDGRWSSHVDIVLHDGNTMKSDGTLALDGTPGPLSGTYGADKANLKLPAPNTVVMQLVDHGTPASTRIYTVADDQATMTETKAFYAHDGTPILQTNLFKRMP